MRRFLTKRHGKAGFTLVELLVTITIVGIISIMTGAIVISAMNTFRAEQEVMAAVDMKEMVCMTLKEHLRKRIEMTLITENLAEPIDQTIAKPTYGTETIDTSDKAYVIDERLKRYHMLYTEGGRIYTLTSNTEGKYYVKDPIVSTTLSVYPAAKETVDAVGDTNGVDKKYCRVPFMAEELYEGFYVDIRFKPIYTNVQGRYRDLQLIVTIYDDVSMTDDHQVASGTETFHMLNIENRQMSVKFQNDTSVRIPPTPSTPDSPQLSPEAKNKVPQAEGFRFCYFV